VDLPNLQNGFAMNGSNQREEEINGSIECHVVAKPKYNPGKTSE